MQESSNLPVAIDVPVMSQEVFAQKVGLSPDTVRGLVEKKNLPTVKKGRHRLINIAALTNDCLQEAKPKSTRQK